MAAIGSVVKSESNPSITTSTGKATSWIITLNNPTAMEITGWEQIKMNHFVKEAQGQIEVGAEGTPHIQGYIRTESVRWSQIKKLFPRAHIEIAKNAIAAKQYCQKTDTRQEKLVCSDINTSIHDAVYEECLHWFCYNRPGPRETGWIRALPSVLSKKDAYFPMMAHCGELHETIREKIYDRAISNMIISGVKHIEFIAVNNITRSAFKKYFPALMYREDELRRQKKFQEEDLKAASEEIQQIT